MMIVSKMIPITIHITVGILCNVILEVDAELEADGDTEGDADIENETGPIYYNRDILSSTHFHFLLNITLFIN